LCFWLIELKGYRRWSAPFVVLGTNALAAFVFSGLLARFLGLIRVTTESGKSVPLKTLIYQSLFTSWLPPTDASLAFGLLMVGICFLAMLVLNRLGLQLRA